MPEDSHLDEADKFFKLQDYLDLIAPARANRRKIVEATLNLAIPADENGILQLTSLRLEQLAKILTDYPDLTKGLLMLARATPRTAKADYDLTVKPYPSSYTIAAATALAAYIKPLLTQNVHKHALLELDDHAFVDKETRRLKGNLPELHLSKALHARMPGMFKKQYVHTANGEKYEIDLGYPLSNRPDDPVRLSIDVKKFGDLKEKDKRVKEVLDQATSFRKYNPQGHFISVISHPHLENQPLIASRIGSSVDALYFVPGDNPEAYAPIAEAICEYIRQNGISIDLADMAASEAHLKDVQRRSAIARMSPPPDSR